MSRKTLTALSILLATTSGSAFAQTFVCPNGAGPGQRQVGMTGGGQGIASVPVCVQEQAPRQAAPEEPQRRLSPPPRLSPQQQQQREEERRKRVQEEKEFEKLRKGYWVFFHDKQRPGSGKECIAFYGNATGSIQFAGPTASYDGATMTLMGLDLPRPDKPEKIRVDLTQDADPPRNISAISFVSPDTPTAGRLTFALASPQEMVNTMEEAYSVKVSIDGKEVISTSYKEGNKAREFLGQCLAGRPGK